MKVSKSKKTRSKLKCRKVKKNYNDRKVSKD